MTKSTIPQRSRNVNVAQLVHGDTSLKPNARSIHAFLSTIIKGDLALDASDKMVILAPMPWDREDSRQGISRDARDTPREWSDIETIRAMKYVQGVCDVFGRASDKTVRQAMLMIAADNPVYDPIKSYLEGLEWDGTARLDRMAVEIFGAEDTPLNSAIVSKFMISAVARRMKTGCQVDSILVLEGPQGCGKSSSLRILGGQWFSDQIPDLRRGAEVGMHLHGIWILELAELNGIRGAAHETLKAFLSRPVDRFRASYGHEANSVERGTVFTATTNDSTYLSDPTGNRRFWPLRCGTVDRPRLRIGRDQYFAEALARYEKGEPWHFDSPSLMAELEAQQGKRRQEDPLEEPILRIIGNRTRVPKTEFRALFPGREPTQSEFRRTAAVLRSLGWEEKDTTDKGEKIKTWKQIKGGPLTPTLGAPPAMFNPSRGSVECTTEAVH